MSEIDAAEYRRLVGAPSDTLAEMDAASYRRLMGGGVAERDVAPRRNLDSSNVDTEPPAKRDFADWLSVAAKPFFVATETTIVPGRRFRADWEIIELKIAIEYDGVIHHTTLSGAWRDAEKGNLAQLNGYLFMRVNAKTINDGSAFTIVQAAIDLRSKEMK